MRWSVHHENIASMEGIFTPLHVGEEVVDPGIVEDQTNCGGGGSDAENRGEDDDAPVPSPAPPPTALPFDLQLTPSSHCSVRLHYSRH